jgi:hypothetical protein
MTQIPRSRRPALAKTRGGLRVFRSDGTTYLVPKGHATKRAKETVNGAYENAGRQPYD